MPRVSPSLSGFFHLAFICQYCCNVLQRNHVVTAILQRPRAAKCNAKSFLHLPVPVKSLVPNPQSQGLVLLSPALCPRGAHVAGQKSFVRRFRIFCPRSHLSPILRSCMAQSATTSRSAGHKPSATRTAALFSILTSPCQFHKFFIFFRFFSFFFFFSILNTPPPPPPAAPVPPTRVQTGGRSPVLPRALPLRSRCCSRGGQRPGRTTVCPPYPPPAAPRHLTRLPLTLRYLRERREEQLSARSCRASSRRRGTARHYTVRGSPTRYGDSNGLRAGGAERGPKSGGAAGLSPRRDVENRTGIPPPAPPPHLHHHRAGRRRRAGARPGRCGAPGTAPPLREKGWRDGVCWEQREMEGWGVFWGRRGEGMWGAEGRIDGGVGWACGGGRRGGTMGFASSGQEEAEG